MKQRKQYIGKPPVHGVLLDVGLRISALERAGLVLPTKTIFIHSSPRKILPTPPNNPRPIIPPSTPTNPSIYFSAMHLEVLVGSRGQWNDLYPLDPDEFIEFTFNLSGLTETPIVYRIFRDGFAAAEDEFVPELIDLETQLGPSIDGYVPNLMGANEELGYSYRIRYVSPTVPIVSRFDPDANRFVIARSREEVLAAFAEEGIPVLGADHGTFDLARTNTDGQSYDGRGIGLAKFFINDDNFAQVEDIYSMAQAYISPFEDPEIDAPLYDAL